MKKLYSVLLLLVLSVPTALFAQHNVQGKVLDKNNEGAIEMATIRLLNQTDSALVQGLLTDAKGSFQLSKVEKGDYILEVRYMGYNNAYTNIRVEDKNLLLKNILLEENVQNLGEVEVRGMAAQMTVKGDTIEYNTAAFKVAENAVVEDLLKKLPGVVVDSDGKITVNGEEITKVRVDGKKFFDGDTQMATKNIPVDIVDKVQVIDQKSEMAQLTGFEDDNTERIINLTIKANRKKGIFGNATAGAGADIDGNLRYDANAFVNILNGESQTALIAGANNTNTMRSGRGRGGMSGGGNGITETQNIGVNNNTELSSTLLMGGDATYNHSTNESVTESERESWLQGSTFNNINTSKSTRENQQGNLRFEMEWRPDTLTTLILQPNIGFNEGISNSRSDYEYFEDGDSISWGNSKNNSISEGNNAGLNLILSRKSAQKRGRTFTINIGGSLNTSESNGFNYSSKTTPDSASLVDQRNQTVSDSYNANVRFSYVEPLWNLQNFLEISANLRANSRNSEKFQYDRALGSEDYNQLDSTYSNRFTNKYFNETLEANFRHQEANYNYMFGLRAEPSQTYSNTYYMDGGEMERNNTVLNWAPTAQFRYNFARRNFLRLDYRGNTSQPSIDQMQPVRNNDNLMNESIGNPTLNPSFNQTLRLMYSSFNAVTFSSFSAGLNGGITQNALVSNSIYDATGKQYRQTVNAESMPYNASGNLMYNTPIIKNRLHFNTNTQMNFNKRYGYSDRTGTMDPFDENGDLRMGYLSTTDSWGGSENLSLTLTTDVIEVGMRGSVRYNNTANSLNEGRTQETWDWTGSGNINLYLPHSITVSNDISYTTREGYSTFSQDELVWNASVDKSLFKNKGTVSLRLYDILQQKLSVRESIGDNYRQLSRYNTLTSYFMLSFTYRITSFGGGASSQDMFRGGRGGGRGGFGGGRGM